jgi:branched-chain amino acid transport system ATP-binding protein
MLLEVNNIHTYYGDSHILQGVSFNVQEGEIVCLLGRNGVGKTTTLKTIMGLVPPKQGSIKFKGLEISGRPPHLISKLGISYIPQERHIFPELTVMENLSLAPNLGKISHELINQKLNEVFDLFPFLKERKNQLASSLSGGEQRILSLARTLVGEFKLLLLDEPFTGLSPLLTAKFQRHLKQINEEKGISILLVEQRALQALEIANRCYIMNKGVIVFEACSEDAKKSDELNSLLGVRLRY